MRVAGTHLGARLPLPLDVDYQGMARLAIVQEGVFSVAVAGAASIEARQAYVDAVRSILVGKRRRRWGKGEVGSVTLRCTEHDETTRRFMLTWSSKHKVHSSL